jgi:hypothetical protein
MPPTGTAPRKIRGVWVTRTGRRLSDAGQRFWEGELRSGRADGKGHYRPKPVGRVEEDGSYAVAGGKVYDPDTGKVRKPIPFRPPQQPTYPYQRSGPKLEGITKQQARVYASPEHQKLVARKYAGVNAPGEIGGGFLDRFASDIGAAVTGLIPGTAEIVKSGVEDLASAGGALGHATGSKHAHGDFSFKRSRRVGKALGKGYLDALTHPRSHPGAFALALLPGYGAAGKLALGADVARVAEGGALARAAAGAKAAIKPTPRMVRSVKVGGANIPIPRAATPEDAAAIRAAAEPVEVARFSSRNYLTHKILSARDRRLVKAIEAGPAAPSSNLNVTSPVAAFGRELARQRKSREARAMAAADAFERFARGKERLSPAEAKAVEMAARGHTPETFVKAHLNARQNEINRLQGADIRSIERIQEATAHHGAHAELAQQAGALLRNPTPKLQQVLGEARALVARRERDLGMTADEIAHSIGKAHDEIAAMAEGRKSIAQQIADLEAAVKQTPEAKAKLDALHQEAIRLGKQAQERGAFYLPFKTTHPLRSPPALMRSPVALGPPRIPRVKALTGAAFRQGRYRTDVIRLLTDASREAARVRLARDYWPKILSLSKDTAEEAGGRYAMPMRVTTKIPDEYRQAVIRPLRGDLTPQEAEAAAHEKALLLQQWRFPSRDAVDPATNTIRGTGEPVRWVDRRAVAGLLVRARGGGVTIGGRDVSLGSLFDSLNAVPKILTLAKPGYALNRVQQALQNLSQQGVFLRENGRFVERLAESLPPADMYELRALAGVGRSRVLSPEAGVGKRAVTKVGDFMGRHTDDASRMLALAHELRTAGLDTPEKVLAALRDPKQQISLEAIGTRVNQEAIPFGKMSDAEARTISRVMFFWPWTRAALEWSARFPFEHPFQAAAAGQVGREGAAYVRKTLGVVPFWARTLFPVTGGKTPYTINLTNVSTPQTVVDTAQLAAGLARKTSPYSNLDTPASELSPGAAFLYGLASGTVRGKGSYPPLEAAWRSAFESIPELQVAQRLRRPPTSVYPGGALPAIGTPFGGAFPRKTNLAALNKQGRQERASHLSPAERGFANVFDDRNTTVQTLRDLGIGSKLPAAVRKSFNRMAQREAAWAKASEGKKPGTRDYYVSRYLADLSLAQQWGYLKPAQVAQARDWAARAPIDDIKSAHRKMSDVVYDKAFQPARDTQRWAEEQAKYKADLDAAVKAGKLTGQQAKRGLAWARKQPPDQIKKARLALERLPA